MSYELVEFCEPQLLPGEPFEGTQEALLGHYDDEPAAISDGRAVWQAYRAAPTKDVKWWVVRVPGEQFARWIADGSSDVERVLDLTSNELIEMQ